MSAVRSLLLLLACMTIMASGLKPCLADTPPLGHPAAIAFYPKSFAAGQTIVVRGQIPFDPAALPSVEFGTVASPLVRITPDGKDLYVLVPGGITSGLLRLRFQDARIADLGPFVLTSDKVWIPCTSSPPTYHVIWSHPQSPAELNVGTQVTGTVRFIDGTYTPGHWSGQSAATGVWPWKSKGFFAETVNVGADGTKVYIRVRGTHVTEMCLPSLGDTTIGKTDTGIFDVKGQNGGPDPPQGGPLPKTTYPYPPGENRYPDSIPYLLPRYPWNWEVLFPEDDSADSEVHGEVNLDAPGDHFELLNYTLHRNRGSIPTLCSAPVVVKLPPRDGTAAPEQELKLGLTLITVNCALPSLAAALTIQPFDTTVAKEDYEFYTWRNGQRQLVTQWPYQSPEDTWQNSSNGSSVHRCTPSGSFKITFRPKSWPDKRAPRPLNLAIKYQPRQPADPKVRTRAYRQTSLLLSPMEIIAHQRGTQYNPGEVVPKAIGEYGYETVMMENADSENAAPGAERDCTVSGADANLDLRRRTTDDDLVKIVLKFPAKVKIKNASLKLLHQGMQVNAALASPETAITRTGASRLNFYKSDGTRITNPGVDLAIPNLATPPPNAYLTKILTEGELTLFIEGANQFGDLPANLMDRLGGAILKWEFKDGTETTTDELLVYRGGFLIFRQPRDAPGTVGTLEFWDGKGRVRHEWEGYGEEFIEDETEMGARIALWTAKSGKTVDHPSTPGHAYNISSGFGHAPPGWWRLRQRTDFKASQQNSESGTGEKKKIKQGGYVKWKQDDELDAARRYTRLYRYDAALAHDRRIGEPEWIMFKFDMFPISPTDAQDRTEIQIHPDGECTDVVMGGTAGCIGIQTYQGCNEVLNTLTRFSGLKLKVQLE